MNEMTAVTKGAEHVRKTNRGKSNKDATWEGNSEK